MEWNDGMEYQLIKIAKTLAVVAGWVQSLAWTTGLDYWTHPNCKIHVIQCKTLPEMAIELCLVPRILISSDGRLP